MSIDSGRIRHGTAGQRRPAVPWFTVLPLAVLLAYADGFWMTSMRGAVGAVERTGEPFTTWWRESMLTLPVFVLAVLGALTGGLALFGPALRTFKAVLATGLLIVAASSIVGIAQDVASSVYDYHLQAQQLAMMNAMRGQCVGDCLQQAEQGSLDVQVKSVLYLSGLLVVTNLLLVGWWWPSAAAGWLSPGLPTGGLALRDRRAGRCAPVSRPWNCRARPVASRTCGGC